MIKHITANDKYVKYITYYVNNSQLYYDADHTKPVYESDMDTVLAYGWVLSDGKYWKITGSDGYSVYYMMSEAYAMLTPDLDHCVPKHSDIEWERSEDVFVKTLFVYGSDDAHLYFDADLTIPVSNKYVEDIAVYGAVYYESILTTVVGFTKATDESPATVYVGEGLFSLVEDSPVPPPGPVPPGPEPDLVLTAKLVYNYPGGEGDVYALHDSTKSHPFNSYEMNHMFKQVADEGALVEIVDEQGNHIEYIKAEHFGDEDYIKNVGFINYAPDHILYVPERMTIWGHLLEDGYTYRAMATMDDDGSGYYGNIAMSWYGIHTLSTLKEAAESSGLTQIVWLDEGYDDDYTPQYELTYGNERIKIYNTQVGFLYLYPES